LGLQLWLSADQVVLRTVKEGDQLAVERNEVNFYGCVWPNSGSRIRTISH
jgi:hypothetical protein